ncbi:MAG: cation:proton antiporter [Candidatus Hermodarchaeota archaeon]|nr:cation:proton antiporter [Candidatus Hermodarchaeota archaeon]
MTWDVITFGLVLAGFIVLVAWFSELLTRITRIPNIVFYLLFSLLLAPFIFLFGAGLIDQQILELIIGLCIAIVVFEGGYSFNRCISTIESHLPGHRRRDCKPLPFRHLLRRILRLSVIAGIITAIVMTFIFIFIAGFPPILAALAGALCAITGPTVINPILRELNIKEDIAETLQGEGELNDPIFGIVAAAIFTAFTIEAIVGTTHLVLIIVLSAVDLVIGILVGLAIGGIGIFLGKYIRPWATIRYGHRFNQTVVVTLDMLGLLCAALIAYGLGKIFGIEAAITATLIAGVLLGQRHRFERHIHNHRTKEELEELEELIEAEIHTFQLPLTHIAVATIFIVSISFTLPFLVTVASQINSVLLALTVVCLLIFVVRPIAIFVATMRSPLSFREKLFLSFLAPRGVIISALALFFAFDITLHPLGSTNLAATLLWFILVIVFVTVLVQGSLASWMARKTGVIASEPEEDSELL